MPEIEIREVERKVPKPVVKYIDKQVNRVLSLSLVLGLYLL